MTNALISTSLGSGDGLIRYIAEINKFPILTDEEEKYHAIEKDNGNVDSAKILVTSHLRLVVKIAGGFRNYGLPQMDLIAEGNIGLMRAVKTFDYKKGFKLATYSMWWIRAYIQDYILKTWSMIKIGTSSVQKKLFFNLKKVKNRILSYTGNRFLTNRDYEKVAEILNVGASEVAEMDARISHSDVSLNAKINGDDNTERIDFLPAKLPSQDVVVHESRERKKQMTLLNEAISTLSDRERCILQMRILTDDKPTLKEVSEKCGVSGERVRQIEVQIMKKIGNFVRDKIDAGVN